MKIPVRNQNEWEAEARGMWFVLRDIFKEWDKSAEDFVHTAVRSLGISFDEVKFIWSICEEIDKAAFFDIFKDEYPDFVNPLNEEWDNE